MAIMKWEDIDLQIKESINLKLLVGFLHCVPMFLGYQNGLAFPTTSSSIFRGDHLVLLHMAIALNLAT